MAVKTYSAGVKDYRETYWMPEYTPKDTDILACFKVTPQPGVPREEAAAAVAAESSTGTWTTVWTDLLTDLDYYKGRAYAIEDVPGDDAVLQFGGGTLGHPWGNAAGAAANRVALEACTEARNEGRQIEKEGKEILTEAAKHSPELKAAMETWKEIKFEFDTVDKLDVAHK